MEMNDLVEYTEQENKDQVATEVESTVQERPEYIPENYWDSEKGTAKLEDVFRELNDANTRAENLRKKLSIKNTSETEYDSVFDNINFDDKQKEDARFYAEVAKKHGLTKKQAEGLIQDIAEKVGVETSNIVSKSKDEIKKELGADADNIIKGMEHYAIEKLNTGEWTQEDKEAFKSMVYDSQSARLMMKLINKNFETTKQPDLAQSGIPNNSFGWSEYYKGMEQVENMIKAGNRTDADLLYRELKSKSAHLR